MGQRLGTPISGNLINCTGYKFTSLGTFTSAELRAALTDETGSGAAVFATSPAITTPDIIGTATNNNANAGSVGQYNEATLVVASQITLANNTPANITSDTLAAGDYDVWGVFGYVPGGSTVTTQVLGWISTTSATFPGNDSGQVSGIGLGAGLTGGSSSFINVVPTRVSLSAPTAVYLSTRALFTSTAPTAFGTLKWRRRR